MQSSTFVLLAAVVAMALAEGQFYVPRAYYTIDAEGHASAPVPLRRLRRSLSPYPYAYGGSAASANANANANADGWGGSSASANANANVRAGGNGGGWGGWGAPPSGGYGSSNPNLLSSGQTRRQSGPVFGRSITAGSAVGVDSSGAGYYDQYTSVGN